MKKQEKEKYFKRKRWTNYRGKSDLILLGTGGGVSCWKVNFPEKNSTTKFSGPAHIFMESYSIEESDNPKQQRQT